MIAKKTEIECPTIEYCKGWNDAVETFENHQILESKCVSIRNNFPNQIKVDGIYLLDKTSLVLLTDGDVYIDVYDLEMKYIGLMNIKHFTSK